MSDKELGALENIVYRPLPPLSPLRYYSHGLSVLAMLVMQTRTVYMYVYGCILNARSIDISYVLVQVHVINAYMYMYVYVYVNNNRRKSLL